MKRFLLIPALILLCAGCFAGTYRTGQEFKYRPSDIDRCVDGDYYNKVYITKIAPCCVFDGKQYYEIEMLCTIIGARDELPITYSFIVTEGDEEQLVFFDRNELYALAQARRLHNPYQRRIFTVKFTSLKPGFFQTEESENK